MARLTTPTAALLRAAVVLSLLLGWAVAPASAHTGGSADVRITLDELPSLLDGVTMVVSTRLAPQLAIDNPTDKVVEIRGIDGESFLRVGPDGAEANLAVADWYTTNDPFGTTPLPEDLGGEPDWRPISTEPAWGWFDHRLHPGPLQAPPEIVEAGVPTDYDTWSIGVLVDGLQTQVTGAFRFQPLRGSLVPRIASAPEIDGLSIAVLPGVVPGFFLDNGTDEVVTVLGREDEPFLRFSPDGPVEANLRSPSWLDSARAEDGAAPVGTVDPEAEPEWLEVAASPRFGWIDPRAALGTPEPEESIAAGGVPAVVDEWQIPLLIGGDGAAVEGVTDWQPLDDPFDRPSGASDGVIGWLAVAAVAALGLVGLVLVRRRG